ncbi:MAG: hypothetical protein AAF840_10370 [Bacteroidota bacterium]
MAELMLRLKRLGKKRIHTVPLRVGAEVRTLADLIKACVTNEVARFNASREESRLLPFLSPAQIQEQSQTGKVTFGDIVNRDQADVVKAIEVALQAWADGLFLVFIDDEEVKSLEEELTLHEGSNITFMRMTFLTGALW